MRKRWKTMKGKVGRWKKPRNEVPWAEEMVVVFGTVIPSPRRKVSAMLEDC